ncbi:MAG: hypothetical protein H7174_01840 [Flavobacterium sp.]|nr:hypothetical protein [Flavobacterium sp.]
MFIVLPTNIFSCGWSESYETTRLALFRAELSGFMKLDHYIYSSDLIMETGRIDNLDQLKNCQEWANKLDPKIKVNDVYEILYNTNSEYFQNTINTKELSEKFKENSFVISLNLSINKAFLDYVAFAKQLEYGSNIDGKWENWDNLEDKNQENNPAATSNIRQKINDLISKQSDAFLKQRYAFLSLRANFYEQNHSEVQRLYNNYFVNNSKTIIGQWAKYYMALGLQDEVKTNYYLSQILMNSDDKANACVQHFKENLLDETLFLAKNDTEKGIIKSIPLLQNPSPTINELKDISKLIPDNALFAFLIQREVNKIEDWIFAPQYSNNSVNYYDLKSQEDYEKAKAENKIKDFEYLKDLKVLLINILPKTTGQQKDFLTTAIAQLCFINDEIQEGSQFVNKISIDSNPSIQVQKNVQMALIALKQDDSKTEATQEKLFNYFNEIENAVENDNTLFKSMYTLYGIASKDFYNKNDIATAGLLFMKSKNKQNNFSEHLYNENYNYPKSYYEFIGYFDRLAQPKDIDDLIKLAEKPNKTNFEKYICSGNINPEINAYLDLKGTLAFRNNNLELALESFEKITKDFWYNNYEFKNYLNENPFFPKALNYANENRKFTYDFNKTNFVKEMIQLRDTKSASAYLKLANAYYNISSYGNAWMMTSYELSGGSYNDYLYGDSSENHKKYGLGNYLNLNLSKQYYQKALKLSKNQEQKAVCSLMIFECDYDNSNNFYVDGILKNFKFGNEIYDFNSIYKNTKVFAKYNCPLLEQFVN